MIKEELLATGNSIFDEAARTDFVWGIGMSINDNSRFDINKWKGRKLLDFALLHVRQEL